MKKSSFAYEIAVPLAIGALIVSVAAHAVGSAQVVDISVGSQQTLESGHTLRRVAIGDPSVADVLIIKGDTAGGLLLIGKSPGSTNLMVWERGKEAPLSYTVNVTTAASRTLLGADTPQVRTLDDTALISGTASTMETHQRAVVAAQIEAHQRAAGSGTANGGAGTVGSGAGDKGGASAGDSIYDTSTINTRSVVQVDVRVVEFSRSVLKQVGLNILKQNNGFTFGSFAPSSLTSATYGSTPTFNSVSPISSAFNLVFNSATRGLFADLSLMESNNLARILAEPTLVALSGQSASFLAGGEIPVPIPEGLGTTSIVYKPYGVGLTLTPTVLSPQRIALKVAPEASQLDFSNVAKVPLLGDLPVIGAFFKQLNYQQNDKELVIIVTPHLVSPLAKGATLPSTPGEQAEQRNGPVWRSLISGAAARDAAPGFSK